MELFIFVVSKVLLSAFYLFTVYQYMKIFLGEARKGWLKTILWSTYFIFQVVYKFIQFLSPQFFLGNYNDKFNDFGIFFLS